jgi:DNA-binding response OmpR family regulator
MKILLVDSSSAFKTYFTDELRAVGYDVDDVSTVESAKKLLLSQDYDLVILDWMLPFANGYSLMQWICRQGLTVDVWVNTDLPANRIKPYTNGHRIFRKSSFSVMDAVRGI